MKYFLFFLFFQTCIYSQYIDINGNVRSNSGTLSYANLILSDSDFGTIADENGNFKLKADLSIDKILLVSHVGYVSKKISLKDSSFDFNDLQIILEEDLNGLNEVVITGTLKDEFVTESSVKVNVITSKKINSFLPSAGSNITDIVKLVNGAQEVISCGVCFTNSISINGLEGPYTSVLLDGIPMYGNLASVYGLSGIPNMIIDRIEVVKGPNSTLFGSEAVAGVINILTKNPKEESAVLFDTQLTSNKEAYVNLALKPKIGKTHGLIAINWDKKKNFDDYNNDGFGDDINLDRLSIFNKWDIYRKSSKPFIISSRYYFEDRRNGVEEYLVNNNYRNIRGNDIIYGESIYTNRFELFGKYVFSFLERFELNYSYSIHNQNSYYGSDYYTANQNIFFSQFTFKKNYGNHDLLFGASIKNNLYDDNTIATQTIENNLVINKDSNQFIPGLFIQDQFKPSEKISLIGGFRVDQYKDHGVVYSPSFHLKYNPDQWLSLRVNIGTGFRIVNLFTEDHAFVSGQREVKLIEDLDPEKSKSIIFNSNYIYTGLKGSGNIDIDLFYTYFSNKIIPDYSNQKFIIYKNSRGYAYTKGISGSLNHTFLNQTALSFTFNYQEARYIEIENNIESIFEIKHSPKWTLALNLKFKINKKWDINSSSNYVGKMELPKVFEMNDNGIINSISRPIKSKPYSIHNININGILKSENELYFGILNILNFRQKESALVGYNDPNYEKGFSPYFDTSYTYAPNEGREFFVGYKFKL